MTPDFVLFDVLTRHGVHGFIRGTEDTDVLWIRSPATPRICSTWNSSPPAGTPRPITIHECLGRAVGGDVTSSGRT